MNILIIGGGISGISAAKVALGEKHDVTILESTSEAGGLMARIANCRVGFKTFFDEIRGKERLTVINDAKIAKADKKDKRFTVTLSDGRILTADRVIIATGLTPYDPVEYKGKRVLTSLEYDAVIDQRQGELPADFNKIGFFLCVGSRSKDYPLCSSVCCSYTLREVKWTLQRAKPEITVFYNDLRFFGQEFYMEKAFRDAGVKFVRANSRYFEEDDEGVTVRYYAGGQLKEERFNYAVLAIGLRPNPQLAELGRMFGFSLNPYGFVNEKAPLQTDAEGVYVSGGALEPMNIKDSILTGFGAGYIAVKGPETLTTTAGRDERLYREDEPEFALTDGDGATCLFYLGADSPYNGIFYEFVSLKFIEAARDLRKAGKSVYVLTRNMVAPSYGEIAYEEARREGVVFVHLEEDETAAFDGNQVRIARQGRELTFNADKVIRFDDYAALFKDREFLSLYRSEPQIRWSPTKWGRRKYHVGFIRHPRDKRWEEREIFGALGEILLDREEERILPEVNEERCSGCGSCKDACPHSAIEMLIKERQLAIFGPVVAAGVPIAHVKEDTCVGCGLCASTCPSDVIAFVER
ncbi:MAG TPA: FAD-dependent oxidoreductase [Syntrophorhabdaceae bacterium]|nr:FAD-dependent oxidoreductase [Syntrophorhabdaceae bacterium]HQM82071.1 FAD-dependent oxidoreductase [Syntrophorhabdaceae bacterium]